MKVQMRCRSSWVALGPNLQCWGLRGRGDRDNSEEASRSASRAEVYVYARGIGMVSGGFHLGFLFFLLGESNDSDSEREWVRNVGK